MIRPYLSDIINDHKSSNKLRVHSRNKVIDYETQYGESKIQVIMSIFFSMWVFLHEHSRVTGLQGKGESIFLTSPLPLPSASQALRY